MRTIEKILKSWIPFKWKFNTKIVVFINTGKYGLH